MARKTQISMFVGTLCGLFISIYLARVWNPYASWFIGGVVMSLSLQLTLPAGKTAKKVGVTLLTGIVGSVVYYISTLLGI